MNRPSITLPVHTTTTRSLASEYSSATVSAARVAHTVNRGRQRAAGLLRRLFGNFSEATVVTVPRGSRVISHRMKDPAGAVGDEQ